MGIPAEDMGDSPLSLESWISAQLPSALPNVFMLTVYYLWCWGLKPGFGIIGAEKAS